MMTCMLFFLQRVVRARARFILETDVVVILL